MEDRKFTTLLRNAERMEEIDCVFYKIIHPKSQKMRDVHKLWEEFHMVAHKIREAYDAEVIRKWREKYVIALDHLPVLPNPELPRAVCESSVTGSKSYS